MSYLAQFAYDRFRDEHRRPRRPIPQGKVEHWVRLCGHLLGGSVYTVMHVFDNERGDAAGTTYTRTERWLRIMRAVKLEAAAIELFAATGWGKWRFVDEGRREGYRRLAKFAISRGFR